LVEKKTISNYNNLINILRREGYVEKTKLQKKLGIAYSTVANLIKDFKSEGILTGIGEDKYVVNPNYATTVGISIGSGQLIMTLLGFDNECFQPGHFEKIGGVLLNLLSKEIDKIEEDLVKCGEISQSYIDEVRTAIENNREKSIINKYPHILIPIYNDIHVIKRILNVFFEGLLLHNDKLKIQAIGLSATGIVDNLGNIIEAYNMDCLANTNLESLIMYDKLQQFKNIGITLSLLQNSNAAVLAEKEYLSHIDEYRDGCKNMVALYSAVGTGCGMVFDNKLYLSSGFPGEIGHMEAPNGALEISLKKQIVEKEKDDLTEAKRCTCGSQSCFDYNIRTYVYGTNKENFAKKMPEDIRKFIEGKPVNAELLGVYLGAMVNIFTSLLNVDVVVFTGKISTSMDLLWNAIDRKRDANKLQYSKNCCKLLVSAYGILSPSVGAALYAYNKKYNLEIKW
jgi:predicted NBD/HSP70 family sugar kinase